MFAYSMILANTIVPGKCKYIRVGGGRGDNVRMSFPF